MEGDPKQLTVLANHWASAGPSDAIRYINVLDDDARYFNDAGVEHIYHVVTFFEDGKQVGLVRLVYRDGESWRTCGVGVGADILQTLEETT